MGKITTDPWHFGRPELAQKYLQTFEIGLVSAQALFAPRRMGKNEFLEQDLIPAAHKSGLLTAYLNLWDEREHPRGALIGALARASSPQGLSALIKKLKAPLKKVKASAKATGLAEGSVEAELVEDPKITSLALSELLRGFDRPDRKLLLVLDEAQALASPAKADHLLSYAELGSRAAVRRRALAACSIPAKIEVERAMAIEPTETTIISYINQTLVNLSDCRV